jgi:pimeloyl-ACP methyl ester carboxylesterase
MNSPLVQPRLADAVLSTGVRLQYAGSGAPGGRAVLFLHGYTDSWFSYSLVLPHLSPSFRAVALSQRGHGDSERPECCYNIADLAADAVALLDALDVGKATVVGHSMGSFIAQRVAIDHPERVERLVLIGSAVNAANEGIIGLNDYVQTLTDPVPREFVHEFQASTIHAPVPDGFLDAVVDESAKLPARVWRDALTGLIGSDHAGRLGEIQARTLVLWGDRDSIFARAEQDLLVETIPDARLVVYPETGHALHWERPERFARDLEAFVRHPGEG